MTDSRCFPTAFYIPCWNVDHANKNLNCFDKNRQIMQPQQQDTQAILRIISMAQAASRQYDAKPDCVLIGHSTKPERCAHLAFRDFPPWSSKKTISFWPWNKSFIDPACLVKMAGYWPPRSSLRCYYRLFWSVNAKQELDQYPAFLISRLVNNTYQEPVHVY